MGDVTWIIFGIFFSGLAFQTISETFASFGDFNPTLIRPLNSSHPYCSYFQNRMPLPAPELRNCSWYKKESCCRQVELDAIFKDIKPILGADDKCQKMLNYMICWVCDPKQNSFYSSSKQKLTFCEESCNRILDACSNAMFKGEPMSNSYSDGRQFCQDHKFHVPDDATDKKCFSLQTALYGAQGNYGLCGKSNVPLILFLIFLLSHFSKFSCQYCFAQ